MADSCTLCQSGTYSTGPGLCLFGQCHYGLETAVIQGASLLMVQMDTGYGRTPACLIIRVVGVKCLPRLRRCRSLQAGVKPGGHRA